MSRDVVLGFDIGKASAGVVALDLTELLACTEATDWGKCVVQKYNWTNPGGLSETELLLLTTRRMDAFLYRLEAKLCTPVYAGLEQYVFGMRGAHGAATHLILMAGLIRGELIQSGIPYVLVYPASLRGFACEKPGRKTNKDLVRENVLSRYGFESDNSDMADAFVVAVIAAGVYFTYTGLLSKWKSALPREKNSVARLQYASVKTRVGLICPEQFVVPCKKVHAFRVVAAYGLTEVQCWKCGYLVKIKPPLKDAAELLQTGERVYL